MTVNRVFISVVLQLIADKLFVALGATVAI